MNIVILGGGTAGWLAALIISSIHKNIHNVSLVSSSEYPVIGVGESSTGFLRGIVNNEAYDFGCNELDFMKFCNATPKLGVYYRGWSDNSQDYFEPLNSYCNPSFIDSDPILIGYVANGIDPSLSTIHGRLFHEGYSGFFIENNFLQSSGLHGYNFDSGLAGEYFKNISIKNGVNYIDSKIVDIHQSESGFIEYLITDSEEKIYGDFFIDASGFRRTISSKMEVNFKKDDRFLVNTALVFKSNNNDKLPATTATARSHGWSWTIPKIENNGTGYVYSDLFTTSDLAYKEICNSYKENVEEIKTIKFYSGHLENFWNKNCIFIGIGSQFFEPLEATSIHGTIAQINLFAISYLSDSLETTIKNFNIDSYNKSILQMVEGFKSLILVHYLTKNKKSLFWTEMRKNALNDDFIKHSYEIIKQRTLNLNDLNNYYGTAGVQLYNQVYSFMKIYEASTAEKEYKKPYNYNLSKKYEEYLVKDIQSKSWVSNKDLINFIKNNYEIRL